MCKQLKVFIAFFILPFFVEAFTKTQANMFGTHIHKSDKQQWLK